MVPDIFQKSSKTVVCVCVCLFLKTGSDKADVTSVSRPFHTFTSPATGKARPPTVDQWKNGTSICLAEGDLRPCRRGMPAIQVMDVVCELRCYSIPLDEKQVILEAFFQANRLDSTEEANQMCIIAHNSAVLHNIA